MPLACVNLGWMLWRGDGGHVRLNASLVEGGCERGSRRPVSEPNGCERATLTASRSSLEEAHASLSLESLSLS